MKRNQVVVPLVLFFVLILLVLNQLYWVHNMRKVYKQEFVELANQVAQQSVLREIAERSEKLGGWLVYSSNVGEVGDTSRYFVKKITTADSVYQFRIDKHDPYTKDKITQFVIKNIMPVNLSVLDSLFRAELRLHYPVSSSYFDYIDMEKHLVLQSGEKPDTKADYLTTDTIVMDIARSIAVVGHVEAPENVLLQKMQYQLLLSVLLILFSVGGLVFVVRTFVIQWRTERLRQNSVNAMTHEFKRPISGALAMVSTIPFYLQRNNTAKVLEYVGAIGTELDKLTAYTQRIQQISNNDKSTISLRLTQTEVLPFVESVAERFRAGSDQVNVSVSASAQACTWPLDQLHVANVLDNLIENALKYSDAGTKVELNVERIPDGIQVSVTDNGYGIPASEQKRIFERYYRVKDKRTVHKAGFGLGLTYCKSIMEAHGGVLTVQSELNKGSVFTCTFYEKKDITN